MDKKVIHAKVVETYEYFNEEMRKLQRSYQLNKNEQLKLKILKTTEVFAKLDAVKNAIKEA